MQRFDRITWNPVQMNGQPCIRGMRLTVRRVVGAVAIDPNREDPFGTKPDGFDGESLFLSDPD